MSEAQDNLTAEVTKAIADIFPKAQAAVVYGSCTDGYVPSVSDIDVLIVGPKDDSVSAALGKLQTRCPDVDPVHLTFDDLAQSEFKGQKADGAYEPHLFDLYRIKRHGRMLLGDASVLGLFPEVTLEAALRDTLPHVRDVFIPKLRSMLGGPEVAENFLTENLNLLLVVTRMIYSIETGQYGSKVTALEYLTNRHPDLAKFLNSLKATYLKRGAEGPNVPVPVIRSFLELADREISGYLKQN